MGIHVRLGSGHKEAARQMQDMQPGVVEVSPIHHVGRSHLENQEGSMSASAIPIEK